MLVLAILTTRSVLLADELETTKRAQIQQANMNMAAMFAGMMLSQLRAFSDAVERAGREEALAECAIAAKFGEPGHLDDAGGHWKYDG